MTLRIHDRSTPLEQVPENLNRALVRSYAGTHASIFENLQAESFLNDLRDRGQWLACDCRGNVDPPPLLSVRRTAGTVSLVRHGITGHDPACPFYRDPEEISSAHGATDNETPLVPFEGPLATLTDTARVNGASGASTTGARADSQGRSPTPRLGRILLTWLHQAELDQIAPEEVRAKPGHTPMAIDPPAQYKKLNRLWTDTFAGDLTLGDVTCRYPSQIAAFLARFRKLEARFPPDVRPQGFAMFAVDGFDHGKSISKVYSHSKRGDHEFEIHGTLRCFGPRAVKGPWFFIGQVAKVASTGRYEIIAGYLHPVFSKSLLLPVDSGLEREVAAALVQQISYWKWRFELPVTLHKPLFDRRGPNGAWIRPDFELIDVAGRRLIIEVLGYTEDTAYMARKSLMRDSLEGRPDVLRVIEWDSETNIDRIRRVMTGVMLESQNAPDV